MPQQQLIDVQGFGYSFERGELTLGRTIYTAFTNISADQATTENVIMGAQSAPIGRTVGTMELGSFTVEWSNIDQRNGFIVELGKLGPYREVLFDISYVMTSPGKPIMYYELISCRLLNEPDDASSGETIGGSMEGSFMYKRINGYVPHAGLPA